MSYCFLLISKISSNFYPRQPKFISAVTGTNGKTSVLHITKEIWKNCNINSATMGTIGLITDNFKKNLSMIREKIYMKKGVVMKKRINNLFRYVLFGLIDGRILFWPYLTPKI